MEKKLTPKQAKFVECYLSNGFNGTQACIDAGYSEKVARTQGAENLAKPNIQKALAELQAKDSEKLNITRQSLLDDIQYAKDMAKDSLSTDYPQYQHFLKSIEMQAKMLGHNEPEKIEISGVMQETEPTF